MTGPTDPSAIRTRPASSTAKHAPAFEITIALRTPTLAYPCHPPSTGIDTASISSPGSNAVRFGPVMKSVNGIEREPFAETMCTTASSAASTGKPSPAGEHVATLPPSVAACRICGEPTVRAAWLSAGTHRTNGSRSISA